MSNRETSFPILPVAAATTLNFVSYLDRVCMSAAAPRMRVEFGLSATELGWVFGVFSLSYAILQAPWGMLSDRLGGRPVVTVAVSGWSVMTAMTAAAIGLRSLIGIRLAFGALEAGLSPAVASIFKQVVPARLRSFSFGVFLSGGRLGGAIAPPVAAALVLWRGWRSAFLLFAVLGLVATVFWASAMRQQSFRKQAVFVNLDWRTLLSTRMLALLVAVFAYTFMWQFYATWFITYLVEDRHLSLQRAAGYASAPFVFGFAGNWAGGYLLDRFAAASGVAKSRSVLGFVSLLSAAVILLVGIHDPLRSRAAWEISVAAGLGDLFLAAAWTSAIDVDPARAGAIAGLMNSSSNFGAMVSPIVIGWAIDRSADWTSVMLLPVAATVLSAVVWPAVNGMGRTQTVSVL